MTTITSLNPSISQNSPTRTFVLTVIESPTQFYGHRDAAYGLTVAAMLNRGETVSNYDVRPVSPVDDYGALATVTNNYGGDWSIAASAITDTTASLVGTGNTILNGTMSQKRYTCIYGTELLSATPAAEIAWAFRNGANVKTVWMVQDGFGFYNIDRPKLAAQTIPVWSQGDVLKHIVYATGSRIVYDVHLTLWAEPKGTTVTASNISA